MTQKFLIIKLSSLGDVVHTLPVANALRNKFPDSRVDWLVGAKGYELLQLIPTLSNVYQFNFNNLKQIRENRYDYVIDVQGLFKTSLISKLIASKKVIGFKGTREFADLFYDEKINVGDLFNTKEHIIDLNLKLISNITNEDNGKVNFQIPKLPSDKISALEHNRYKKILFLPSTTWESKKWVLNYWFELVKLLSGHYKIILSAAAFDTRYLEPLISQLSNHNVAFDNYIGKTNISDLIYLIQNVDLVIGLDSGSLHLASAIRHDSGKPEVIGIYGPTSIYRNGPYHLLDNCMYLSGLECLPCRKKICPLGHHKCMKDLSPELVAKKIDECLMLKSK